MLAETRNWTWGYELELGDVRRDCAIPSHLGHWEYAETDICNVHPPYRGRASDPLGIDPPVGGEINIKPGKSIKETIDRIMETINWFRLNSDFPTAGCTNVGHIHVHIPGLRNDIEALKKLTKYIRDNQKDAIEACWGYKEHPLMKETHTARTYMKFDGGRMMPDWMADNIINKAENFNDFIRLQCCGKDGISRGRPFRYAINTYCLKHIDTIEFRLFRATLDLEELESAFRFVLYFLSSALTTQTSTKEIIRIGNFKFAPMTYDHELYVAWENSKWDKSRGKKERKFYDVNAS